MLMCNACRKERSSVVIFCAHTCAGVQPSFSMTPMRRIIATALRPPLLLSHSELNFSIPPAFFDGVPVPVQHQKVQLLVCVCI